MKELQPNNTLNNPDLLNKYSICITLIKDIIQSCINFIQLFNKKRSLFCQIAVNPLLVNNKN